MLKITSIVFLCVAGTSLALPSLLLNKLGDGLRYDYATDSKGNQHLVDLGLTLDDVAEAARYNPTRSNIYHLFTRDNPTVSQPLLPNSPALLQLTNFKNNRRTIVLLHGWMDSATSDFNSVLIPGPTCVHVAASRSNDDYVFRVFLAAEDVNVIVVDWSVGASSISYRVVIENTIASGIAVAQFIDWVNQETASSAVQYHIIGHGFGGHQAGIIGRNLQGDVAYITGLDPALIGWVNHIERFQPRDGMYTEVIHTNYGINGYLEDLAQVDFYPNGGISMPGCNSNACDHARSYFYFAESLSSGVFTGRQCINYFAAVLNTCDLLPGRLQMGGLRPKIGSSGVYLLETNAAPPFSQG